MKLKTTRLSFIFSLIILISCQQDDIREYYQSNQELVASAQSWYTNQLTAKSSLATDARQSTPSKVSVDWRNAKSFLISNGKLIVVPIRHLNISKYGKNFSYSSNLVIKVSSKGQITNGQYLELLSRTRGVKKIEGEIITNWAEGNEIPGVVVISCDLSNDLVTAKITGAFSNKKPTQISLRYQGNQNNAGGRLGPNNDGPNETIKGGCTDTYLVHSYSDGSEDWTYLYTECPDNFDDGTPPPSGGGGGGDGSGAAASWEINKIKSTALNPCMQTILAIIKNLTNGSVAQNIQKFSGSTPGYNWELKDGALTAGTGLTDPPALYNKSTGTISTTFDSQAWLNATELSWARTILHESIHAYLSVYFSSDPKNFVLTYSQMVQDWGTLQNWNDVHHEEFARSLVNQIANSLEEYAVSKGYNLPRQFYEDMSWSGLQSTSTFQNLPASDQKRILDVIAVELTGADTQGNTQAQKDTNAGC